MTKLLFARETEKVVVVESTDSKGRENPTKNENNGPQCQAIPNHWFTITAKMLNHVTNFETNFAREKHVCVCVRIEGKKKLLHCHLRLQPPQFLLLVVFFFMNGHFVFAFDCFFGKGGGRENHVSRLTLRKSRGVQGDNAREKGIKTGAHQVPSPLQATPSRPARPPPAPYPCEASARPASPVRGPRGRSRARHRRWAR